MCRKNAVYAALILGCGVGLLLSFLFSGAFLRTVLAAALLVAGLLLLRR